MFDFTLVVANLANPPERGEQSGDEISGVFTNSLLLTTCPPDKLSALVEEIRPILRRSGGICLVSDALSVRH